MHFVPGVFEALSSDASFALLPKENSTHGTVIETYDLLRSSTVGVENVVQDEITLEIRHCLVVRRGLALRDIRRVMSHEQVRLSRLSNVDPFDKLAVPRH